MVKWYIKSHEVRQLIARHCKMLYTQLILRHALKFLHKSPRTERTHKEIMSSLFDDLMFTKLWENRGDESEGPLTSLTCSR